MKKYTGTIILGIITLIFGVDTLLSFSDNATFSELAHNYLRQEPLLGFTTLIGFFTVLLAHFWWFRSKNK